jgi:hypothetical protein
VPEGGRVLLGSGGVPMVRDGSVLLPPNSLVIIGR